MVLFNTISADIKTKSVDVILKSTTILKEMRIVQLSSYGFENLGFFKNAHGAHCTEIDFALSFGAVLVKMIDWSKTESRDFFGIIIDQENSQMLHLLPKSC